MITNNLAELINLEHSNPHKIRDYCYRDGCPTDWYRNGIAKSRKGEQLKYSCEECATNRYYPLRRKEE